MTDYSEIALVRSMGMLAETQAAIAHNLANVDTASFKRRAPLAQPGRTFASELQAKLPTLRYGEGIDWRPGNPHETGSRLDVTLAADTFFRLQDGQGRVFFSRNGKLQIDREGNVVTPSGMHYLDPEGRPLRLAAGETPPTDIAIAPNGEITSPTGGQSYGQFGVFKVADPQRLQPVGAGVYQYQGSEPPLPAQDGVRQGYEEGSNVDSLQELVQMIVVQRSFGATQRALGSVGRMHDRLIDNLNR